MHALQCTVYIYTIFIFTFNVLGPAEGQQTEYCFCKFSGSASKPYMKIVNTASAAAAGVPYAWLLR